MNYNKCTIKELVKDSNYFVIGVYYKNDHFAFSIYNKLIDKFEKQNILASAYIWHSMMFITLCNDVVYIILKASYDTMRYNFDRVYYEKGIDNNIIDNIIAPCLYEVE